jgi:hypothetical protein
MKLFTLLLAVVAVSAQAKSLKATTSGNWSAPQTWSCNCVPTSGDQVNIPEGITITVNKAVIAKSIHITVAGELDINNGTLDINESDNIVVLPGGRIMAKGVGGTIYVGKTSHYFEHGRTLNGPATLNKMISPLALMFFSADSNEGNVTLTWASTGEVKVKRYQILSSNDSITFQPVASVNGANNAFQRKAYTFSLANPALEGEYYRLEVIKNDSTHMILSTAAAK